VGVAMSQENPESEKKRLAILIYVFGSYISFYTDVLDELAEFVANGEQVLRKCSCLS
jgi:hypothetical protein